MTLPRDGSLITMSALLQTLYKRSSGSMASPLGSTQGERL